MSVVFAIQNQMYYDKENEILAPRFDLTPAEEYGTLKFLLSPSAAPFHTEEIVLELKTGLENIKPEDYLLLVGNPVLIGITTAIAADIIGSVQFLQWSGKDKKYLPIKANIF